MLRGCRNFCALGPGSRCPSLDALDFSSCPVFSGECILDESSGLIDFCPRLRTLNLSNCAALTYLKIKFPTSTEVKKDAETDERKVPSAQLSELAAPTAMGRLEDI